MTERSECRFTVKESSNSRPWIAVELYGRLPSVKGNLGLELRPGVTLEEAQEVARYLKGWVKAISVS
jgi:hypothetical protein